MICAYDKAYLDKARTVLGRMLDFAVHDLKYDIEEFFGMFIASGLAARFESGDFRLIVGMSGVELAYRVLDETGIEHGRVKPVYTVERSEAYWAGWALAYYQWHTAMTFDEIVGCVSIKEILALYSPYHEMDIRQFVDKLNELCIRSNAETRLKSMRNKAGISQRQLAEFSGVPVRTIQQYEQRQKNINKAQAEYLVMLSKALCCEVNELMEKYEP